MQINSSIVRSISLTVPDGKDVQLVDTHKKKLPNFYMIGNGTMNKHRIQSIDLIAECITLSKPALVVLNAIKNGIRYDNADGEVKICMSDLTPALQQQFQKGFKELKERGLAKRTKRSHYMINPNALIPLDYDKAIELWIKSPSAVLVS